MRGARFIEASEKNMYALNNWIKIAFFCHNYTKKEEIKEEINYVLIPSIITIDNIYKTNNFKDSIPIFVPKIPITKPIIAAPQVIEMLSGGAKLNMDFLKKTALKNNKWLNKYEKKIQKVILLQQNLINLRKKKILKNKKLFPNSNNIMKKMLLFKTHLINLRKKKILKNESVFDM